MNTPYEWTPLIVIHTLAALSALVLGGVLLSRRKGTTAHRMLGKLWVTLMATVALVSFGIYRDTYSWIHGLAVFTLVMLVVGVTLARRHMVAAHQKTMIGLYVGALIVAGLFTLAPGRLIGRSLMAFWGR